MSIFRANTAFAAVVLLCGSFVAQGEVGPAVGTAPSANSAQGDTQGSDGTIPLGPFKLGGGFTDNRLVATLTGGYTTPYVWDITGGKPCGDQFDITRGNNNCWVNQVDLTVSVDASWKTGPNPQNHATLAFQPTYEFVPFSIAPIPKENLKLPAKCADQKTYMTDAECYGWIKKQATVWAQQTGGTKGWIGGALYPDLQYRYGTIVQSGKDYDANQLVYGGGLRIVGPRFPNSVVATWPYISVAYDKVSNYGGTKAPSPTGVEDQYLQVESQGEIFLPTKSLLGADSNSIFLVKMTTSHPTSAKGWEVSRTFQLIVDDGGKVKPAISYQSGTDKGFTFDSQWLLQLIFPFTGHQNASPAKPPAVN